MSSLISISIVSHQQMHLAVQLIADLQLYCLEENFEIILTSNVTEDLRINLKEFRFPIRFIENFTPKGFGENHNSALMRAQGDFFCVFNPDIRLRENPFPALVTLAQQPSVGVVAPRIFSTAGLREDSSRRFPTISELFLKACGCGSQVVPDTSSLSSPDWVAGMFMLFPASVFRAIGGFDERFFLYYEDVDICARLALAGYKRLVSPEVAVVHDARRSSHRNLRFAMMHLRSIIRFFSSEVYRNVRKVSRN